MKKMCASCKFIPCELDQSLVLQGKSPGVCRHSHILSDAAADLRSLPAPTVGAQEISSQVAYTHGVYGQSDRRIQTYQNPLLLQTKLTHEHEDVLCFICMCMHLTNH